MVRFPTAPFAPRRTGCYGCKRNSLSDGACGVKGYPCTHWGMDLFAVGIRDVWAPEAGNIVAVSDGSSPPFVGFGPGVVLMKGASGIYHLLSHLQAGTTLVRVGQEVVEGAPIAKFDPGMAHCHWEVRKAPTGPSETNTINPEAWLQATRGSGSGVKVLLALAGLFALGMLASRLTSRGRLSA